jgi:WD40 repeat protein
VFRDDDSLSANPDLWSSIEQLAFSPDGTLLAGATATELLLWEVPNRKKVAALRGIYPGVQFSPDGRTLAAGHADGPVRLWTLPDLAPWRAFTLTEGEPLAIGFNGDTTAGLAFDRTGHHLATTGLDHTLRLWDPHGGEEVGRLTADDQPLSDVTFSPNGDLLAAVTGNTATVASPARR